MRLFHSLVFASLVFTAASVSAQAYRDKIEPYPIDQARKQNAKPLMVIRYNQENIYYQLPLYNAVQKTLQVKPTAMFTFVSKVPFTGQPEADNAAENQARKNWQDVLQSLSDMGLPEQQMRVQFEKSNQLLQNEILVFVE